MSSKASEAKLFRPPEALYAHVPICRSKCAYCDFFSLPAASIAEDFLVRLVDATLARAEELATRFGASTFRTVYVGGGTPTALPPALIGRLLSGIAAIAGKPEEWSVEANPESLTPATLEPMLSAGVTRLSLGVQSLDDGRLAFVGRPHDAAQAIEALRLAKRSGLALSADLMAGIPGGGGASLTKDVETFLDLGVGHLSIYDLMLEECTPLAESVGSGELELQDEDEAWTERSAADTYLAARGFRRYEISNYAPVGAECRHNLAYWRMDSYIGAGPSAVSTLIRAEDRGSERGSSLRIEEAKDIDAYLNGSEDSAAETAIESREAAFEFIMMATRTAFGLDFEAFRERFGIEVETLIGGTLHAWTEHVVAGAPWPSGERPQGTGRRLALDKSGLDLQSRFLTECLAEMESKFPRTGTL